MVPVHRGAGVIWTRCGPTTCISTSGLTWTWTFLSTQNGWIREAGRMSSSAAARAVNRGGQRIALHGKASACLYTGAGSARTRLLLRLTSNTMNARILERSRTSATYAMQDLHTTLISDTISVLTLAKGPLHALYAAVALVGMAIATVIKNAVAVFGSGSTRNA